MKKLVLAAMTVLALGAAAAEQGVVNATVLNARREPKLNSPVMWKIRNGAVVKVTRVCENNWLEIEVASPAPVYVSEAYVVGGKAVSPVRMYTGKGNSFPSWGELKKGEQVILTDDRGYGWVRIVPPERMRAYVYGMYVKKANVVYVMSEVDGCKAHVTLLDEPWNVPSAKPEAAKPEAKPADKPAPAKPEAKPEAKSAAPAKPEANPAVKPAPAKPEAKPAVKPAPAKPEAKPAVKPEKKPAAKPEAKPADKPAPPKPEVKPVDKPAPAKPEAKPETKPAPAKPVAKAAPVKPDANLTALGIKGTAKGKPVKLTGTVVAVKSDIKAAQFALLDDSNANRGFVYYPEKAAELKKLEETKVTVQGESFLPPGWKTPVVVVRKIEKAR